MKSYFQGDWNEKYLEQEKLRSIQYPKDPNLETITESEQKAVKISCEASFTIAADLLLSRDNFGSHCISCWREHVSPETA